MKNVYLTLLMITFVICLYSFSIAQNTNNSNSQEEKYYKFSEVDQKIKITSKPSPRTDGKCSDDSGKISLRVYFYKSGKINKVEIINPSFCEQFNENAVYSAKEIKFKPAIKDGQNVSTVGIIEYSWQKY